MPKCTSDMQPPKLDSTITPDQPSQSRLDARRLADTLLHQTDSSGSQPTQIGRVICLPGCMFSIENHISYGETRFVPALVPC